MFLKPYEYSLYSVIYIEFNNWQNSSKVVKGRIVDILGVRTVKGIQEWLLGFWNCYSSILVLVIWVCSLCENSSGCTYLTCTLFYRYVNKNWA